MERGPRPPSPCTVVARRRGWRREARGREAGEERRREAEARGGEAEAEAEAEIGGGGGGEA